MSSQRERTEQYIAGVQVQRAHLDSLPPYQDLVRETPFAWCIVDVAPFDPRQTLVQAAELDHGILIKRSSIHGTSPALEGISTDEVGLEFLLERERTPEYQAALLAGIGSPEQATELIERLQEGSFGEGNRGLLFGQFYQRHTDKFMGLLQKDPAMPGIAQALNVLNEARTIAQSALSEDIMMPTGSQHLQIFRNDIVKR